ncbi:ABC transporter ATP-binding protein [Gordonia zhaorongruii]|uniref:ABC transporter ATP-binding protein n=1 Tax=Gordonia zhaorongruii TaxID=2597659 RepID=UPI001F2CB103|nr:ABC transporter ATP-binding protein [Gordonia zhaorongruii]
MHRGTVTAVDDVTVTVPAGKITGLLGPSGCGKTTLMRAIVGTQRNVRGRVEVLGLPAGSAALRRRVGYVTQAASIYTDLTVQQNVRYFAGVFDAEDAVGDALRAVDLTARADHLAADLSGGQLSRVSIACALVTKPSVLVLDEPTVGLDPVLRADLWTRFADLAASGVTLLVSSHVMDEAAHCDELILMREGSLVAQLTPQELRDRSGHDNLEDAFLELIEDSAA